MSFIGAVRTANFIRAKLFYYTFVISLLLLLTACDNKKPPSGSIVEDLEAASAGEPEEDIEIARVNDEVLYSSELEGLIKAGMSANDSLNIIKRYAQSWVRSRLMANHAANQPDFDPGMIQKKGRRIPQQPYYVCFSSTIYR